MEAMHQGHITLKTARGHSVGTSTFEQLKALEMGKSTSAGGGPSTDTIET